MRLSRSLLAVLLVVAFAGPSVAGSLTITDTFSISSGGCLNGNAQFLYDAPVNGADQRPQSATSRRTLTLTQR